jgi:hypothetical protein
MVNHSAVGPVAWVAAERVVMFADVNRICRYEGQALYRLMIETSDNCDGRRCGHAQRRPVLRRGE